MEYRGIDVSKYQGNIDYNKVKGDGVQFVIIRIGYGMYENQIDPKFEENYKKAKACNLPVGIYLYSYALNNKDALKEAEVTLKWLKNRNLNLPVYFDIEDKSQTTLSKETLTSMCETFCERIEKAGYWAGIYANKYWFTTHLDYEKLQEKYTVWVAQYNSQNTYKGKYDMWQYTSKGQVDGIANNVDMNILYRNIFHNLNGKEEILDNVLPNLKNYKGTSIVDALNSVGYNSSFDSRKKLYKQVGYNDKYRGTASQNLNLLKKLGATSNKVEYYKASYKGLSLVDGLKSIGVDSSFSSRTKLAQANGIQN
ncbi:MAG: DUF3597 family protein [Bacilli bacterium]|nr:DUF3597 family protein [Bacilli bacterium]